MCVLLQVYGSHDLVNPLRDVPGLDGVCRYDSEVCGQRERGQDEGDHESDGTVPRAALGIMVHHIILYHLHISLHHHYDAQGTSVCLSVCLSVMSCLFHYLVWRNILLF